MRLNLGCGHDRREGWVNVDKIEGCRPDNIVDLEVVPWPWPDSCAEELLLSHILEHIGQTAAVFIAFMRELWRVSAPSALIRVVVPHPRCDEFLWDATHTRPITAEGLRMFSQARNEEMIRRGNPETPLGLYAGIDFELLDTRYIWRPPWPQRLQDHDITEEQLHVLLGRELNVAKEISIRSRLRGSGRRYWNAAGGSGRDQR